MGELNQLTAAVVKRGRDEEAASLVLAARVFAAVAFFAGLGSGWLLRGWAL